MNTGWQRQLEAAILSDAPLEDIVALLRQFKARGVSRGEVSAALESLHATASDEALDDRIREVSDFVASFCAPPMTVWES
jgi:hypothetical protein